MPAFCERREELLILFSQWRYEIRIFIVSLVLKRSHEPLGHRILLALISAGLCGQKNCDCSGHGPHHRSHSPNTMSIAPRMAVVSASMWPFDMKSIACRWLNAVGRILQR